MIETEASAVVPATPGEVYALLSDPVRFDAARGLSGEIVSDQEMADGTRSVRSRTQAPRGGTIETHTVIVERVPDRLVALRHVAAPTIALSARLLRFGRTECERTLTLAPHPDGGTLVETRSLWRVKPALFYLYLARLNPGALRRATESQLESLQSALARAPR
jgi:polyketide cyclase/dehydrase/lipid transport protein